MPTTDEPLEPGPALPPAVSDSRYRGIRLAHYRIDLVVCAIIALSAILVWPVGEYSLLDDWAYLRSLKTLHDESRVEVLDWNPMSLVGHLAWGIAWTKTLGFSFNTARLSVVVLHVIECLTLVRLLRWAGVGEAMTLAAVLSLIFNPLHFVHSFTYMTDVPALTWTLAALALYARGLVPNALSPRSVEDSGQTLASSRRNPGVADAALGLHSAAACRALWLFGGSLAAGWAFLNRQNGILVPAAFVLYALVCDRSLLRPRQFLPAIVPAIVLIGAGQWWYQVVHGPTSTHEASFEQIRNFIAHPPWSELPRIAFSYVTYLGWIVLPLSTGFVATIFRGERNMSRWLSLAGTWVVANGFALYVVSEQRYFPSIWNVVTPYGFFEIDALYAGRHPLRWNAHVGFLLAILCLVSALVLWRSILGDRSAASPETRLVVLRRFTVLLFSLQLCYCVATAPILFDRHLLILVPNAIVVIALHAATSGARFHVLPFVTLLVPAMFYSVAATHDLHETSQAVWNVGRRLAEAGNDPAEINAGYAFDGWHTYAQMESHRDVTYPRWWDLHWWEGVWPRATDESLRIRRKGWWYGIVRPDVEPRYIVAPIEDDDVPSLEMEFAVEERVTYRTWWPWKLGQVVALRVRAADQEAAHDSSSTDVNPPRRTE